MTSQALRATFAAGAAALVAVVWLGCSGDDTSSSPGVVTDPNVLCDQLCKRVIGTCNEGAKRMFRTEEQCIKACLMFDTGVVGGTTGNTIRCRLAQAEAGNCNGAGILGGTACGSPCDGFCRVTAKTCTGSGAAQNPFGTEETCVETCESKIRFDSAASQGTEQEFFGADTLNCRAQHLLLALSQQDPHCSHGAVESAVCKGAGAGADAGGP